MNGLTTTHETAVRLADAGSPARNRRLALSPVKAALLVLMAMVAVGQLFPLVWLVNYSFLKSGEFYSDAILKWPDEFQWKNYRDAFTYGHVPEYFLNSVIVTAASIAGTLLLSLTMAYAFTRMRWKWREVSKNLILIGMMIPIHATLLPNYILFHKVGLLNHYLGLILPYIAVSIPISIYIVSGFLESLPTAVEESAVIDGCSIYGVIFRIVTPMVAPALGTVGVMTFISCWNEFIMAYTFITEESLKTLPFSIIQFVGQYSSNYGAQFAVLTIIALPSLLMYLLFTEQIARGLTAGAVKG